MKWELHVHTAQGSLCSRVPAGEAVVRHAEAGFGGMVITDHYNLANVAGRPGTPLEQAQAWLEGYREARRTGEALGLTVLFGAEVTLSGSANDFLIYGAQPGFLLENPELYRLELPALHALVKRYNALLIQAHPHRLSYCYPVAPDLVDGYEVYNGNPRHDSHNQRSAVLARENPSLVYIAGSDYHQVEDLGLGSMEIGGQILTSAELADSLRGMTQKR